MKKIRESRQNYELDWKLNLTDVAYLPGAAEIQMLAEREFDPAPEQAKPRSRKTSHCCRKCGQRRPSTTDYFRRLPDGRWHRYCNDCSPNYKEKAAKMEAIEIQQMNENIAEAERRERTRINALSAPPGYTSPELEQTRALINNILIRYGGGA